LNTKRVIPPFLRTPRPWRLHVKKRQNEFWRSIRLRVFWLVNNMQRNGRDSSLRSEWHDTDSVSVILNPAGGGMKNLFQWEKAKSVKMNFDDPTGNGFLGWALANNLMVEIFRSANEWPAPVTTGTKQEISSLPIPNSPPCTCHGSLLALDPPSLRMKRGGSGGEFTALLNRYGWYVFYFFLSALRVRGGYMSKSVKMNFDDPYGYRFVGWSITCNAMGEILRFAQNDTITVQSFWIPPQAGWRISFGGYK